MRRRSVLRAGVVLPLAALAGCAGSPASSPASSASPTPTADRDDDAPPPSRTPTDGSVSDDETRTPAGAPDESTRSPSGTPTTASDLDLREANVTGVAVSGSAGTVTFDVTLYHDDDGEDGYANWWQVERLDGTQLGRRDLLHAHSTREFTRSTSVEIPGDVTCVVVRGHDQTHDYGGQAALVNLESGTTRFVRQGPDPQSFSTSDCPRA